VAIEPPPDACYKKIQEIIAPTSARYARSVRWFTRAEAWHIGKPAGGTTMKKRVTKVSFEQTVFASLAIVTVMVCSALLNAVNNLQLIA
jgi:hypothetical protein